VTFPQPFGPDDNAEFTSEYEWKGLVVMNVFGHMGAAFVPSEMGDCDVIVLPSNNQNRLDKCHQTAMVNQSYRKGEFSNRSCAI